MAAAGLILINFERLTRRHKHALKKIISHAARSSQPQLPLGGCKLAVYCRMRQLHLKHCQSVTISISYSYLVNRTSRRSVASGETVAADQRTQPQGGRVELELGKGRGREGMEDERREMGDRGPIIRQRGKVDYDDGL